jgi:glutamate-1-semialdehyde 2,1-aminomutase
MKNLISNEGYQNSKILFDKGINDKVYIKNKSYIDLSNCAGSLILGHNHRIFKESIKKYLHNNLSIFAHPNLHARNFSQTIKKIFPNFSNIIYCNSGTEAVSKALRISRAINYKKKYIVSVSGSWHGSVDQLLFYPGKKMKPIPLSSGITKNDKKNIIIIPYGDIILSKKILDKKKKNINCLIIEPIQASLPLQNSKKYLKFLEIYCKQNQIILIFDEIITAVRTKNKSVQNNYKIKPDITIIGKIFGGGLPIGIIGITKKIQRDLKKQKRNVFFGGTFSGNSLSTFLGNEIIKYILANKKILKNLDDKAKFFENNLNMFITKNNLDLKIYRYSSILRIVFTKNTVINRIQRDFFETKNTSKIRLFRKYLFKNKIYYSTSGIIFFSSLLSNNSLDYIIRYIKKGFIKYFK